MGPYRAIQITKVHYIKPVFSQYQEPQTGIDGKILNVESKPYRYLNLNLTGIL